MLLISNFRARDDYYGTTYSDEEETNSKSHIVRFNGYTYNELMKKMGLYGSLNNASNGRLT